MKPGEADEFGHCIHLQPVERCSTCKDYQSVYLTGGGMHYHLNPKCKNLQAGWDQVIAKGGTPAPLETVALAKAKELGRKQCRLCRRAAAASN